MGRQIRTVDVAVALILLAAISVLLELAGVPLQYIFYAILLCLGGFYARRAWKRSAP